MSSLQAEVVRLQTLLDAANKERGALAQANEAKAADVKSLETELRDCQVRGGNRRRIGARQTSVVGARADLGKARVGVPGSLRRVAVSARTWVQCARVRSCISLLTFQPAGA